jgi:signal transduction histidine kinase
LAVFRDISETKAMQQMMVQTEKMLSIGGIAAGIAHEINNPLGIVLQASQNLAQRSRVDFPKNLAVAESIGLDMSLMAEYMKARKLDMFIQDIRDAATRASMIIRHMLDFSRRSESRRSECKIETIIDGAIALARSDFDLKKNYDFRKINVSVESDEIVPTINCTETEIEQVLLNLLRNSAQAMAKAETRIKDPRIDIRVMNRGGWVRIEVEDNGPGIPEDLQSRIMEPFFTTKDPGVGTGLGLSVSYFIVTNGHGGKFSVSSEPGKGTCFVIELPTEETRGAKK